jgi:hypothetical protein
MKYTDISNQTLSEDFDDIDFQQKMDSAQQQFDLSDKKRKERTYNYRDSNPWGENVDLIVDKIKDAEDGGKGAMGTGKPLTVHQKLRSLAARGYDDRRILHILKKVYPDQAVPHAINWYNGKPEGTSPKQYVVPDNDSTFTDIPHTEDIRKDLANTLISEGGVGILKSLWNIGAAKVKNVKDGLASTKYTDGDLMRHAYKDLPRETSNQLNLDLLKNEVLKSRYKVMTDTRDAIAKMDDVQVKSLVNKMNNLEKIRSKSTTREF